MLGTGVGSAAWIAALSICCWPGVGSGGVSSPCMVSSSSSPDPMGSLSIVGDSSEALKARGLIPAGIPGLAIAGTGV